MIRFGTVCVAWMVAAIGIASAQPKIALDGIRNTASYTPDGFVNTGIAQGSIFVIFGDALGPDDLQSATVPLPVELAGESVRIVSVNNYLKCYLVFLSAHAIAAILPSATPLGPATLTVSYRGQTSNSAAVTVAHRKVGIYTLNQAGSGPAVAQNYNSSDDQPVNTLVTPARPGQLVTLWAT